MGQQVHRVSVRKEKVLIKRTRPLRGDQRSILRIRVTLEHLYILSYVIPDLRSIATLHVVTGLHSHKFVMTKNKKLLKT